VGFISFEYLDWKVQQARDLLNRVDVGVEGEGECSICQEIGANARLLTCNHSFHWHCILTWLGRDEDENCPNCRQPWWVTE
jgi:hypothetical protein